MLSIRFIKFNLFNFKLLSHSNIQRFKIDYKHIYCQFCIHINYVANIIIYSLQVVILMQIKFNFIVVANCRNIWHCKRIGQNYYLNKISMLKCDILLFFRLLLKEVNFEFWHNFDRTNSKNVINILFYNGNIFFLEYL